MKPPLVVLKFGSSVLSGTSRLPAVVHEIYRCYRQGYKVVAVVSAIGRHTDLLFDEAMRIAAPAGPDAALAQLLSTGELQSAALLTMALHRAGIPCELLDATTISLVLGGERLDAKPLVLDVDAVLNKLATAPVLVLPGFVGRHECGGTALMGRGGSDLTAVFLADQLRAGECRLVKDVDGIYERDPADVCDAAADERPHRYGTVTYEEALRVAEVLVQPKAIEYLQANGNTARVSALLHDDGTVVGSATTTTADLTPSAPLKVLLLGLGEVGLGVYQHLQQLPEFFEVVGINVRDVHKDRGCHVPSDLLENDIGELLTRPHDLLVDVSGDRPNAYAMIEERLHAGCPVVTASKRLTADRGAVFASIASKTGASLRYSAAVGGSAPMVETVKRAAAQGSIIRLRGVLNGTCNYVLDRIAHGVSFEDAVVEAQAQGFAEADVSRDLSGQDTEDKLRILARIAFGAEHDDFTILREGLKAVTPTQFELAKERGQEIRLVATIEAGGRAQVVPEALAADDFLTGAREEENRLIINGAENRSWQVSGKGAGRWPAAEAVISDMLEIHAASVQVKEYSPMNATTADCHAETQP
jgi:homoserine dehydrogenase